MTVSHFLSCHTWFDLIQSPCPCTQDPPAPMRHLLSDAHLHMPATSAQDPPSTSGGRISTAMKPSSLTKPLTAESPSSSLKPTKPTQPQYHQVKLSYFDVAARVFAVALIHFSITYQIVKGKSRQRRLVNSAELRREKVAKQNKLQLLYWIQLVQLQYDVLC